jgi:SAM-dependent methyltransferase
MKETSKADIRRFNDYLYKRIFRGQGIDVGAGDDCFGQGLFKDVVTCKPFDIKDGNAQEVHKYVDKQFDFVYSSNCLEHMFDPKIALENWIKITKTNGYVVFTVPDEDLYEQGHFPSKFNGDHKWTFTVYKQKSWSSKSINLIEFLKQFEDIKILRIQIVDNNYDYSKKNKDQTLGNAEAFIECVLQKIN